MSGEKATNTPKNCQRIVVVSGKSAKDVGDGPGSKTTSSSPSVSDKSLLNTAIDDGTDDQYESTSSEGSTSDEEDESTDSEQEHSGTGENLQSRLAAFIPRLREANAELSGADITSNRQIDSVADDAEHYIEMNLGLGVLTEKREGEVQLSETDSESDESSISDDEPEQSNENILSKLKGEATPSPNKRKIEELG